MNEDLREFQASDYFIIGGGAASILMDDDDLKFRSTKDVNLVLETDQHIIPIKDDSIDKLSAILLDHEYFYLIRRHFVPSET